MPHVAKDSWSIKNSSSQNLVLGSKAHVWFTLPKKLKHQYKIRLSSIENDLSNVDFKKNE